MKKTISLVLVFILMLSVPTVVNASGVDVAPYDIGQNASDFWIAADGLAYISYFCACDSLTDHVTITVKLEKRLLLVFWTDVEEWTITSSDLTVSDVLQYQLTKSGTYRCTIVYEVTNTDGTTDTKEYQKELEYDPA